MKTMFGKRYPNCVKKKATKEEVEMKTEAYYGGEDRERKTRRKQLREAATEEDVPKRRHLTPLGRT